MGRERVPMSSKTLSWDKRCTCCATEYPRMSDSALFVCSSFIVTLSLSFSSHGARVFALLLNKRLFKPVSSRSWGPGRAEPRAPLAGPPSKLVTAKRAPPGKLLFSFEVIYSICNTQETQISIFPIYCMK